MSLKSALSIKKEHMVFTNIALHDLQVCVRLRLKKLSAHFIPLEGSVALITGSTGVS